MSNNLIDAAGQPVPLGREVGRGGEGAVWETQRPGQVAKVYHHAIDSEKADKLAALAGAARPDLLAVAAWPTTTLHRLRGGPIVGVLMPLVKGHVELHQLYSPVHRRLHFPDRDWSFLVHVAMNCAAAVETVHDAGHVIGDLNQKGVLVNPQGTVHLIDCDSFQIRSNARLFRCEVGVPELTPPELQGVSFRDVDRTPNHDRFGLALLIFHLLFMGRHPYRGRFGGGGEMTIERAIDEGRFAFSRNAASFQMRPPPGALEMNAIPGQVADMFEAAFARGEPVRPTAAEWRATLGGLRSKLSRCRADASHVYPGTLSDCVWCAIEAAGGPAFFTSVSASANFDGGFDLLAVWNRISAVRRPPPSGAFRLPRPPRNITAVPMPIHMDWQALGQPLPVPRPLKSPLADLPSLPGPFVPEVVPEDPVLAAEVVPVVPTMPPDNFVAAVDAKYKRPRSRLMRLLFPGSYEYQAERLAAEEQSQQHQLRWRVLIAETTRRREQVLASNAARRSAWEIECARLRQARTGLDERNDRRRRQWEADTRRISDLRDAYTRQNAAVAEQWQRDLKAYEAARRKADSHNALIAAAKSARQQEVQRRQQRFDTLMNTMESLPRMWTGEAAAFAKQYDEALTRLQTSRGEYESLRAAFDARKQALTHGQREAQLRDHLENALIDNARISGLGPARKAKLAAYGIETAFDVRQNNLSGTPGFGDVLLSAIYAWADEIERQFVPSSRQGVPPTELRKLHTAFHGQRVALQRQLQAGIEMLQIISGRAEKRLAELEAVAAGRVNDLAQAEADASIA